MRGSRWRADGFSVAHAEKRSGGDRNGKIELERWIKFVIWIHLSECENILHKLLLHLISSARQHAIQYTHKHMLSPSHSREQFDETYHVVTIGIVIII